MTSHWTSLPATATTTCLTALKASGPLTPSLNFSPPKAHQGTNTDVKKRVSRKTASKMPEATVPMKNPSHDRRARSTSAVPHTVRFPDHCRLTVADVPFILSKSTAASHSLPANLQNLVSLLKKAKPQSNVAKDFTDSIHRNVCIVGNGGLAQEQQRD
ncbi:hypothetical protein MRX96_007818 [Rhipicephalus microplus]